MIGMVRNFLPSPLLPLPPDRPRRSHNCGQFFVAWCILVCRQITKKQQMKTMSHLDFYQISLLGHCTISRPRLTCLYMLDWSKIKSFQCRSRVKIIGGAHHERQSHEVLGSPGECSSGKFLYRGSLK